MENRKRNFAGLSFITGAILGGAALYYLNTPKGKELTAKVKDQGLELKLKAQKRAEELAEQAKIKAEKLQKQASLIASDVRNTIESSYENTKTSVIQAGANVKSKVESVLPEHNEVSDFTKGVAKAKRAVKNGVEA